MSPVKWEMNQCSLATYSLSVKCIMQICSKDTKQYIQKNSTMTMTEIPQLKVQKLNLKYEDSASSRGNKHCCVLQRSNSVIVKNKANPSGRRNPWITQLLFAVVLRGVICWMTWNHFNSKAIDLKMYLKDSCHLILFLVRLTFYKVGLTNMLCEIVFFVNQSL